jgi:predicted extracellular nuclease
MRKFAIPFAVLALFTLGVTGSRAQGTPTVFINEIHYDNTGVDTGEFVEIAGPAGTSLTGYQIILYNGSNGQSYDTKNLSGSIPNQSNGFGTVLLSYPDTAQGTMQNGAPDGVALVLNNVVQQFLSYEGSFTATNGPASTLTSTNIGVSENGSGPVGDSLRLVGSGTGYSDFTWAPSAPATPGAVNTGQTFLGTGASIAINNVSVTEGNSGTVTATFVVTVNGTHSGVVFDIATADGTGGNAATASDNDYQPRSLTGQSIPSSASTYQFDVTVNGDAVFEQNEQFLVNVTNVTGASTADGQGAGTIANDDAVTSDVVISQVYGAGGNSGAALRNDYIELFNRGSSTVSLAGWSVQYQSAAGAATWSVTPLTGDMAPGTYYLIHEGSGGANGSLLPAADASGSIGMAAGAGKVALLNTTAPASGDCPTFTATADLVGYGTTASCFEGTAPTSNIGATTAALRKRGGCFDSNNNNVDLSAGSPMPRNSASAVHACTFTTVAIHQIQGDGSESPLAGQDVQTSGIVTGRKTNGFFIQTAGDEDADPATSQGLFVFTSTAPAVAVGDAVTARGTATEFFNLTQLESSLPGDVTIDSSGNTVPAATTLTAGILDPNGTADQLERFEGMRMHADTLVSVASSNEFGEVLTVLAGAGRPMREPGIERSLPIPPDPTSGVVDCCIPTWDENPERIMVDTDGLIGSTRLAVTSNVTMGPVTGPLDFSFSAYKVLPETTPAASANMSAVPVPVPLADELTVAGFNIEHFANNETQRRKAALAIRQVLHSPDVIGHVEIFDLVSLQALATQVNNDAAAFGEFPAYEARLVEGSGDQHLGFLIKTSRVQIVSTTQELAGQTYVDPVSGNSLLLHDRPPFVLRANALLPGRGPRPFIVVVNHLRSFIDIELVEGDGRRVRAKRTAQAEATAQLLQSLQTDNPGVPVISIGDYNAYQFNDGYTDPIAIVKGTPTADEEIVVDGSPDLVEPNFTNLTDTLPLEQQYSFIFEGTPQALDHMLLNTVADTLVTRYAIARNNADFPEGPLYASDVTRPERNSDHDMPVAYFSFPLTSDLSVTATGPGGVIQTGAAFGYTVTVSNDGPDAASSLTLSLPASAGLRFSAIVTPAGWTCTTPSSGAAGPISCVGGSLAAGEDVTFAVTALVDCAVGDGAVIVQNASIAGGNVDPLGSNNSATATVVAVNPPPSIDGVISPITVPPLPGAPSAGAVVANAQLGSPVAVDNCSATIVRTGVPAGNVFPVGQTTVTYTATDSGGATASATQTVKVLNAVESLQAIAADLQAIIAASTKAQLTKRATDALKNVQKAIVELGQSDEQDAISRITLAIGDLDGILDRNLLPASVVKPLMRRLAGASWLLARQALDAAIAESGLNVQTLIGGVLLQQGNTAAAGEHYQLASGAYWLVVTLVQ